MATRKYFTENGIRALPTDSIPHSKFLSLFLECLFGPRKLDPIMVKTTNNIAKPACIRMGRKSLWVDCITLKNELVLKWLQIYIAKFNSQKPLDKRLLFIT